MLVEKMNAHPGEWQIWLFKTRWWVSIKAFFWGAIGFVIQGEDLWNRESGNHMACRLGDRLIEAAWPAVHVANARETLKSNCIIHAFAFQPDLTEDERPMFDSKLNDFVGRPYDVILIGERAVKGYLRLLDLVRTGKLPSMDQGVVDITGEAALICYELVARAAFSAGRDLGDSTVFGPPQLWEAARRGQLVYRGVMGG